MNIDPIIFYFQRVATYNPIKVAVELFLIGIVVSWAVNFLEGTRGERLFRGVFLVLISGVLVLNFVVERFGFERIEYLYRGFLIALLIVAVAAFQPEIRRALMRIGQGNIVLGSSQQLSRTIEEIITAIRHMAQTKTGAIIVVEQQIALGEFIETGSKIDSKVTADLLETIFYKGTPLHDMAVVIRADRIVAASVQLPLAEGGSVDTLQLGSRHRAAIGITGSSDAITLVVSEETGVVSMAIDGNLIRNVSDSEIRKRLTSPQEEPTLVRRFWASKERKHRQKGRKA